MSTPNVANVYSNWNQSTNANVERIMDDATYSSAHPDDTVVLAGPPRLANAEGADGPISNLSVIGMLQNISVNQQKPFQPMMAIGSSRSFFVGGKAQGSAQIQRLFMNTDNLLRRLYTNILGVFNPVTQSGDNNLSLNPPANRDNQNYFINLDSEFFLIPFGIGVVFKNKIRGGIGGFYMELCVIPNLSTAVQSGQSMIMEGCSIFFDRVVPLDVDQNDSALLTEFQKIIANSQVVNNKAANSASGSVV